MSAADINARLNVVCRDFIELYQQQKVPEETINHLEELIEKREQYEFMELALGFRKTMAFLDHDEYTDKLTTGWHLLDEGMALEQKARNAVAAVKDLKGRSPAAKVLKKLPRTCTGQVLGEVAHQH